MYSCIQELHLYYHSRAAKEIHIFTILSLSIFCLQKKSPNHINHVPKGRQID